MCLSVWYTEREEYVGDDIQYITIVSLCVCAAEILQANDSLTQVINLYRQQVKGEVVNGNNSANTRRITGEQQWVNDTCIHGDDRVT